MRDPDLARPDEGPASAFSEVSMRSGAAGMPHVQVGRVVLDVMYT